jgi:ribosome biogenesis protein
MPPLEYDNDPDMEEEDEGEQIRIALTLASDCTDRSVQVPSEPLAVPASIGRQGLSSILNHLLNRLEEEEEESKDTDTGTNNEPTDDASLLKPLKFEFILGKTNRLLRCGVEKEARRSGISLETAIPITYFPSQEAPTSQGESDPLPDWIGCMAYVKMGLHSVVCTGLYDGSVHLFQPQDDVLTRLCEPVPLHKSPIKCMDAYYCDKDATLWMASGSMDHTLLVSQWNQQHVLQGYTTCVEGHSAALSSVDFFGAHTLLASGDWDGGVAIWDYSNTTESESSQEEHVTKKSKNNDTQKQPLTTVKNNKQITPKSLIQAHTSNVSGVSWGNCEIRNGGSSQHLVTGSWDHSIKLWDAERRDCLLTLNGSRVVSCLDTSYFSTGIVATGHPDGTIRLWDVRVQDSKESSLHVSDNTLKASHKGWITDVQWSPYNAYQLTSTSHDGTVKCWDIRSPLPLYTVRALPKGEKSLCVAMGENLGYIFAGGTDCVVKQFRSKV